jgi:hypothetical protein
VYCRLRERKRENGKELDSEEDCEGFLIEIQSCSECIRAF